MQCFFRVAKIDWCKLQSANYTRSDLGIYRHVQAYREK